MNITLRSKVTKELTQVHHGFDADLFTYLMPPGARLIEYGGSEKGDVVHLKLPLVGDWISQIVEHGQTSDAFYFIDEGKTLPFPIKSWRHRHTLQRTNNQTTIIDDMTFSTGYLLLDFLFYPILYLSFWPRTWQYQRYYST